MIKNLEAMHSGRSSKPKGNGIKEGAVLLVCVYAVVFWLPGFAIAWLYPKAAIGHYFCGILFFKRANGLTTQKILQQLWSFYIMSKY